MTTKTQVDWLVLLDDEAWDSGQSEAAPREETPSGPVSAKNVHSALQWTLPLTLLLLVAAVFLWDSVVTDGQSDESKLPPAPLASADRLAAQAHSATLTEHLRIHAGGPDVAVIEASAAELEALYVETFAGLGLATGHGAGAPDGHLLVTLQTEEVEWDSASGRVILPSPAHLPASGLWKQSDLLRQSWVIALGDRAVGEAGDVYRVPSGWLPLLDGLRLWLLWDAGGPLAAGREAIVVWMYTGDGSHLSSAEAAELCRTYALWNRSPLTYFIPLGCTPVNEPVFSALPKSNLWELAAIDLPQIPGGVDRDTLSLTKTNKTRRVVLALFIEHAAERYGRETLPVLLAALQEHDGWDTLIPAVFGVSAAEFEAGWQAWLGEEYGMAVMGTD